MGPQSGPGSEGSEGSACLWQAGSEGGGGGFAAGCVEGLWKKVLKMDRPLAGGFLSLTALWAEGCGLPLCGNAYKVSVTDSPFCVIWHEKHSADWLAALASPYPALPDFSTGKRVTRFSGRFASLRIVFPCHPCSGGRIKHLEASLRKRLCSKHGLLCHCGGPA